MFLPRFLGMVIDSALNLFDNCEF